MEQFIGEIRMFGGNFAPKDWAFCDGQLLAISQNAALFSILGTTYGGNGQVTFGLPDLRGRVPMHAGSGPGLTPRNLGETAGTESVTLLSTQMPAHTHTVGCHTSADTGEPQGAIPATEVSGAAAVYSGQPADGTMNPAMIAPAGGNQPHANVQPFQCVNFIIALEGIFPSRN